MSTMSPNQRFNRRSMPWTASTCFRAICVAALDDAASRSSAAFFSACRLAHRFRLLHQRVGGSSSASPAPPPDTNHDGDASLSACGRECTCLPLPGRAIVSKSR